MGEQITVHVVAYPDRKYLMMRYRDPFTGKHVARSTKTAHEKTAMKAAAKWEAELREGRYLPPAMMTWQDFRERYESEVVNGLSPQTDQKVHHIFNVLDRTINPQRLRRPI